MEGRYIPYTEVLKKVHEYARYKYPNSQIRNFPFDRWGMLEQLDAMTVIGLTREKDAVTGEYKYYSMRERPELHVLQTRGGDFVLMEGSKSVAMYATRRQALDAMWKSAHSQVKARADAAQPREKKFRRKLILS